MDHPSKVALNDGSTFHKVLPTKTRLGFAVAILLLANATVVFAQASSTATANQIQALQKRLDALQTQMSEVQGEVQRLSGSSGARSHPEPSDLSAAIQAEQKGVLTQVETELTPK